MSTQIAELELDQSSAAGISVSALGCIRDDEILDTDRPLRVARAIASAVLISVPFWALFAFAIYLMV